MSEESSGKSVWGSIAVVIAAIITTIGLLIVNDKMPVPKFLQPTATTTSSPVPQICVDIINNLLLPVKIQIDNVDQGVMDAKTNWCFPIQHAPVIVAFEVVRQTDENGYPIGDNVVGLWDTVYNGSYLFIDRQIGDYIFFYPRIFDDLEKDCNVIVNDGLEGQQNAGIIRAGQAIYLGYYRLYSNSNVTLYCFDGSIYWLGVHPSYGYGNPIEVDANGFVNLRFTYK